MSWPLAVRPPACSVLETSQRLLATFNAGAAIVPPAAIARLPNVRHET